MRNHKTWLPMFMVKYTFISTQECVFLFYLLKIITNAITKANAIIVTTIRAKNSNFIISNNSISIIDTTSILVINHVCKWQPHSAFLIFLLIIYEVRYIVNMYTNIFLLL